MVYAIQATITACEQDQDGKTPDDGKRKCPKHVEFDSNNKFEKLVHLVGFIIRKHTHLSSNCSGESSTVRI